MKTKNFLAELAQFGWTLGRNGGKHIILENRLIQVERPLGLRHQDVREIDPIVVCIQCKAAGLLWDPNRQRARPNPNHPYYARYTAALNQQRAA